MPEITDFNIDADKLFAIAWRMVSNETVQDVRDFVAKVTEAAKIVTGAAQRIAGVEPDADAQSRFITPQEHRLSQQISDAILAYHEG